MDILYICREGENEELRYSLRSLRFLPHDRVVIVGGIPDWVNHAAVICVPTDQTKFGRHDAWVQKYENARMNLETGLSYLKGQNAVLMNDDFFLTSQVQEVLPMRWEGPGAFRKAFNSVRVVASRYVEGELATLAWCEEQFSRSNSYALHVPFPFQPEAMKHLLDSMPHHQPPLHIRTAYGNMMDLDAQVLEVDPKISGDTEKRGFVRLNGKIISHPSRLDDLPRPYVSTNERSFKAFKVGKLIRQMHPNKSPYEL